MLGVHINFQATGDGWVQLSLTVLVALTVTPSTLKGVGLTLLH